MQSLVIAHVTGVVTAPVTYLLVGGVLAALVMLTLWRETVTANTTQFFSRSMAALAFATSRVTVVVFTTAMVASPGGPPALYILLNFICLYLAARCLPTAICEFCPQHRAAQEAAGETPIDWSTEWRAVKYQTAVFGLTAGLVYVVLPQSGGITFLGLASAALLGATVRVSGALVSMARSAIQEVRPVMLVLVGSLIGSWLLVVAAGTLTGDHAAMLIKGAQMSDILALIAGLLALQTNYIVIGTRLRAEAERQSHEASRTRGELDLLSRVTSDLYDDSNAQLRRQRDHAHSLARRAEDMERMLAIGIRIQQHKNIKELLQMVAELVRENLGFDTVIIRILNDRTQSFEPKAYVGLNPDAQETVMNHRISIAEYQMMTEPRFRVGRSYFLKNLTPLYDRPVRDAASQDARISDQWDEVERLIVPLIDDDAGEQTIGYISVEDPGDPDRSVVDVIDTLETIASLATIAIRNLNRYREVGEKNEKLKHYAEKLSSLNKMKSNFVATISHEFRTPLTSIKAYCETLLKNSENMDRDILKEFLVVIQEESNRLMALIEDILDFSQMESGAVRFERTSCSLNEIVTIAANELEKNFEGKKLTLNAQLPAVEVKVRAERDLMKQLLINLLHNASKFTPEGG
ncbi:MAG TPA: histidine kinase dimerization/phospho-acceptor domain-containing protein, partial [Candidatus Krumholzibacteria bacterium]|nr:histidine kinase dimerization/phospho-acceptor domain-containing protein [Candidatus Krumholzibacteria bacterium]